MKPVYKLSHILHGVSHTALMSDPEVSGLALDSRRVTPGTVFLAVAGGQVHGLQFVDSAIQNGAQVVLVDERDFVPDSHFPLVGVRGLQQNLSKIAGAFYSHPSVTLKVMGVTGTNGKSTIVSLAAQLEQLLGRSSATIGTLGYGLIDEQVIETGMTTPDAISCQAMLADLKAKKAEFVAMEVSSHGIDQHRVAAVQYDVSVLTNITRDHLDYHGSFEAYAATKASFVDHQNCKVAVINIDDPECEIIADTLRRKGKYVITYGQHHRKADVKASNIQYSLNGFTCDVSSPWGQGVISSTLVGAFNVNNVLAAISVSCALEADFQRVCQACAALNAVAGRMQKVAIPANNDLGNMAPTEAATLPSVFVDYAHTPDALDNALQALVPHVQNALWVVFGCGGDRDKGKRPLMGAVAEKFAQHIVITSDNPRTENADSILEDIEQGIVGSKKNVTSIVDRKQAIEYAVAACDENDCVLIAGKGHENYQIIGQTKIAFDDCLIAGECLQERMKTANENDLEKSRGKSC
ncbi:UDP-N-acetylmuramoyl-L-alanyl-D-glutamate--2, 6-diaminopimelate ligase [Thalassocella blandensis]|nr:UDP-N-acetylmuramoyl-L-alanyl-D-glutamate--2, 6-diaminopimelate ligase [Thalassocella blandensis]